MRMAIKALVRQLTFRVLFRSGGRWIEPGMTSRRKKERERERQRERGERVREGRERGREGGREGGERE